MLNEWRKTTLGEVVNFRRGHDLPKTEMKEGTIPVVGSNGIIGYHNQHTTDAPCVSIGRSGNVGNPHIVMEKCWAHNTTLYIDDFKGNDEVFIYYFLQTLNLENFRGGSAVPTLNRNHIHPLPVKLPPLPEQKAIAHILGSLDDKIELNRKMNETLEAMAQALFKSWFVDFDPVIDNALAAGNEIPEELAERAEQRKAINDNHKPLPVEIRKLFPSEFIYTDELSWIPKGWKVKSVKNVIQVNPRISLGKGCIAPFADMKALPTAGFSISDIIKKPYSGGAKFNNGDVLLARITPCLENGKTGIVDFLEADEVGFGSTEFIVLRPVGAISTPYVACLAREEAFREHCKQAMVGSSGRQRVQNACFSNFYLAIPENTQVLEQFTKLTKANFAKVTKQTAQSRSLATIRDTLLPKLLSGELRIKDAEKLMEGTT